MHTRKTSSFALFIAAALSLLAASCGTADGAQPEPSTDAPETTTTLVAPAASNATSTTTASSTTSTSTSTSATSSTTSTTMAPEVAFEDLPSLFDSLGAESGDGNALVPGDYRSEQLSSAIRHSTSDEASVWDPPSDSVYAIGPPGFDVRSDAVVFFVDIAGIPEPSDVGVHVPSSPDYTPVTSDADLDAFFSGTPGLVLIDSYVASQGSSWWEFTTDGTTSESFDHCNFGAVCLNIAFIEGPGYFVAGDEWTYRLWRLSDGDGVAYAWFQAPNDAYPTALPFGEGLVEGSTIVG